MILQQQFLVILTIILYLVNSTEIGNLLTKRKLVS